MVSRAALLLLIVSFVAHLMLAAAPVYAEQVKEGGQSSESADLLDAGDVDTDTDLGPVEIPFSEMKLEDRFSAHLTAGYRFFSSDDYTARAAPYEDIHSGPTLSAFGSFSGKNHKFFLEGYFLSDDDYMGDLIYDYKGAYRLNLRSESLLHTTDRLSLFSLSPVSMLGMTYVPNPLDNGSRYSIRAEQDLASLRIRLGTYPIHLNMHYWRMKKDGDSQLRFSDQHFYPFGGTNTISSKSNPVDWETHEGKIGFDSHFGPVDLIYDFTYRQFSNHSSIPQAYYVDRTGAPFNYQQPAGTYDHNEVPDSNYYSHTVKLHTEQTGGIVGAASYSFGKRTNNSSLSSGADGLSNTLQNAAGDIVYTPCKEFSLAVRFRHQEIDRETATLTVPAFIPSTLYAKQGLDTQKDVISTTLSFRPVNDVTVKGEYRGDFTHRDGTSSWDPYGTQSGVSIPESSERHRGVLTVLGKPVKNLRLKARYSYTTVSNPEYGNTPDERHEGQLLATYSLKDKLGFSANYLIIQDHNDDSILWSLNAPAYDPVRLSGDRKQNSGTVSAWGNILDGRVSLTGTTGFIRVETDQQTLFSATTGANSATASDYTSKAYLYGISIASRPLEKLTTSLDFQQVRSSAEFAPVNRPYPAPFDMAGVKEISWLKTVENTVSFRGEYQLRPNLACGVAYLFREYTDERNHQFDGSVHSVTTSLTAKW